MVVSIIAQLMGGVPEAGVRILLTLFAGYPLAFVHRSYFFKKDAFLQHCYFALSGLALMFFCFGFDTWHSLFDVTVAYLLCRFLRGKDICVIIGCSWFMFHLLAGYYFTESAEYDILWTIPQCILTLRLIGLVWDVYDGAYYESLSKDNQDTALVEAPSFLEIAGYSYFFGSFMVGPQFPLRRFRKFVAGDYADPKTGKPPNNYLPCLYRLVPGLIYMVAHNIFMPLFPNEYFLSQHFADHNLLIKIWHLFLWFKCVMFRYQAVWLLAEGVCILTTLGWGSQRPDGHVVWDGVRNIRLTKFELGSTFQSVVESFNCNTNLWASRYVFKRLKFVGNKTVSHISTLMFLAIWHGFHLGYFVCFGFEFLCVISERQAADLRNRFPKFLEFEKKQPGRIFMWIVGKVCVTLGCTYGFIPFGFTKKERWFPILSEIYFIGWIVLIIIWPTFYNVASDRLKRLPKPVEDEEVEELAKEDD